MAVLLQEIVSLYPALSPPTLSASESNRACNVLALLQSVAAHPETKAPFLKARIFEYLYPFLTTTSDAKAFEYLRLTTLGVLGALLKVDDTEAVNSMINSGFVPLFFHVMETGTELSKTVATFIVHKIIIDDVGLQYICATPERFLAIARVLASMVDEVSSTTLLKHIVLCYLRLTDDPRARIVLQTNLPGALRDGAANKWFKKQDDSVAKRCLEQLLDNLGLPSGGSPPPCPAPTAGGVTHPSPAPAAGGAPHPGPGPVAGGSPGGSSQAGPSRFHPHPVPTAGGSPGGSFQAGPSRVHPGLAPAAGGSPGGSSQAGPGRVHPGLVPTAGGSPGGSSEAGPSRVHPGPAPAAGGAPNPAPVPVAGGSPGGSSQAGSSRRCRR